MNKIFLVTALSLLVLVLMNTVNVNVYGQLNPNPNPKCIIYDFEIGRIAAGKHVIVIDSNCPRHADTIAIYVGSYGYYIVAVVPTSNGSEVYMTNK